MNKPLPKVVVVLGETATGKSDLAVKLARKFGGEIISADSRQIYRGLDIGSGKIKKNEMKGVRHYLLDIADPRKKRYTAADFASAAKSAAATILSRGKLPIVCGGTGFYIENFLRDGGLPDVPPNDKLRAKLKKLGAEVLFAKLRRLDPIRAKNIDPRNKVRVIRAIEIATALGYVPKQKTKINYRTLSIGLTLPPEKIREKIHARLMKRMQGDALVKEVRRLHEEGVCYRRLYDFGLEYRYVALYIQKKLSREKMLSELEKEIYRYAKRQMTWFKRDTRLDSRGRSVDARRENVKWFSPKENKRIEKLVKTFIDKK